jgi:hypothetical protein
MKTNNSILIQLPATEDELENEIQRQNETGDIANDPDQMFKIVFTRLAMVETEIDRSLEKGEITEDEAEELRQKYVHGYIKSLYGD